jgi:hypothetical protein
MAQKTEANSVSKAKNGKPTPALVRQVTDKVMTLWRRDLAVARERARYRQR